MALQATSWILFQQSFKNIFVFSLYQVARAGRFGTKGLAITFVSDEKDAKILNEVQDRFEVNVGELPEEIDLSTYSKFFWTIYIYVNNDFKKVEKPPLAIWYK